MRVVFRSTLAFVALYLVMLGGLAWWVERELQAVATSLMENTARLLGNQIAAAMSGAALNQLLAADAATHQQLAQLLEDLSSRSDVVASIAVVDRDGRVVVSDEMEAGRQLAIPEVVFQGPTHEQFLRPLSPFVGGRYHLFVPLLQAQGIVGYIRVSLSSHRIEALYRRARNRLLIAALGGLIGIAVLGVMLRIQLMRRSAALARTLEATARGEAVPSARRRDEFSQVLEAAGRLGRELMESRERSSQAQRRISALANFMDVGLLLLKADTSIEFANAVARQLLGANEPVELEARWTQLMPAFERALARVRSGEAATTRVDVEIPTDGRPRRLRLELHHASEDTHEGYLVLVKDRDLLDAFETDLRLATQMRSLARVYGALAHELKAPLGAMALNLELLSDALTTDEEESAPDLATRRQRYATVLREELARLNRSLLAVLNQTTSLGEGRERFDLRELIQDLETLVGPQAKHQRVALDVRVPPTEVMLDAQRDRLKQAMLNITTNALEVMPDGGRMEIVLATENGHARITVRDSGPGIAPEIVEKIYSMYFTTKDGGTGIGLYVARSVVETLGGAIQVSSQPGAGTCFDVRLPLSSGEA